VIRLEHDTRPIPQRDFPGGMPSIAIARPWSSPRPSGQAASDLPDILHPDVKTLFILRRAMTFREVFLLRTSDKARRPRPWQPVQGVRVHIRDHKHGGQRHWRATAGGHDADGPAPVDQHILGPPVKSSARCGAGIAKRSRIGTDIIGNCIRPAAPR